MRASTVASILAALVLAIVQCTTADYDRNRYEAICRASDINDVAIELSAGQLIKRAGFQYEDYYSVATDGYITYILRIRNPLMEPDTKFRGPPVIMFHGANIDQSSYVMASNAEHYPEHYPREPEYGPISSSNRSLAFTLANNGYDVWLIGQRGSNKENMAYTDKVATSRWLMPYFYPEKDMYNKSRTKQYWQYGLDDIIANEIGTQIDLVLRLTGANEFSIVSFSLSTPTTMAFLAQNEDYARATRVYVQMAPAIAADHEFFLDKLYFEKLCPRFPTRGIGFTPTFWIKPAVRRLIIKLSKSFDLRYNLIRRLLNGIFGPSLKYNTNLERNVLSHIFQPVSFKSVKHYCQNSLSKQLTYFDYGKKENIAKYGRPDPPKYDISKLAVQNWLVLGGTNDGLADSTTVERLVEKTQSPKPAKIIWAPGYNHLDILAGTEVDKYVVLPILDELNSHYDN